MKHSPREHQRVYLTFYLRIFEGDSFIGYLIDISKDGMMIMSEEKLVEDRVYNLRMKLPSSLEWKGKNVKDRYIEFSADCRWSKHDDVDKEFYLNGFNFSGLTEEDNDLIHKLIKEYRIR